MNLRMILAAAALVVICGALVVWAWVGRSDPDAAGPAVVANDPVEVERAARAAIRERPNDPSAHLQLARALRRQRRYDEAAVALNIAGKLGIPPAEGRREAALLVAAQDWPPQAKGLLQQATRDNPDDPEVLAAVAGAFDAKGFWAESEPLYTRLLAREPDNADWRFARGVARMRTSLHTPAADDFQHVLARNPSHYDARLFLAHSFLGDARMLEAEKELQTCRRERPKDLGPLVGLAKCALEKDDLSGAEQLLGEAAAIDANSPLVLQDLAALYLRQQRLQQAIATLKHLLLIDPNHRQAHLHLSQALLADGKPDEARRHEERYRELDRLEEERLTSRRGMQ